MTGCFFSFMFRDPEHRMFLGRGKDFRCLLVFSSSELYLAIWEDTTTFFENHIDIENSNIIFPKSTAVFFSLKNTVIHTTLLDQDVTMAKELKWEKRSHRISCLHIAAPFIITATTSPWVFVYVGLDTSFQ